MAIVGLLIVGESSRLVVVETGVEVVNVRLLEGRGRSTIAKVAEEEEEKVEA